VTFLCHPPSSATPEIYGDPEVHPRTKGCHRDNLNTIGPRSCYDQVQSLPGTLVTDLGVGHDLVIRMDRGFNTYGPRMRLDEGRVVANFAAQTVHSLTSSPLIRMNNRDSAMAFRKRPARHPQVAVREQIWQERTISQAVHPVPIGSLTTSHCAIAWLWRETRPGSIACGRAPNDLFRSMRMRPKALCSLVPHKCLPMQFVLLASVKFAKTSIELKWNALPAQLGPRSVRGPFL
jgi:hypothetical protein